MEKMTYVNAINFALDNANLDNREVREKLEQLKTSLVNKSSGKRSLTPTQKENIHIKENILDEMVSGNSYSISAMIKGFESCKGLSNQKVSALVKQLVNDKLITRSEIKGRAFFTKD